MDVLYINENQINAMMCNTHVSQNYKFSPAVQSELGVEAHCHSSCCISLSQLGVPANKFMPKFKLEWFHNNWLIFLWILHSPSLITVILFSGKFVFSLTNRDKLNFEH